MSQTLRLERFSKVLAPSKLPSFRRRGAPAAAGAGWFRVPQLLLRNALPAVRRPLAVAAACAGLLAGAASAHAQSYTYTVGGVFANSDWNADGTNAIRTPGGPFSGSFTVDTGSLSVTALEIDTTFYSIFSGNQVVTSGTYNYGVGGTDDEMGTPGGRNINLGQPTLPLFVGLTTKLDGTASYDGRTGSIIQIMDKRSAPTRIYRPRLTIFMEGVDFGSEDGSPIDAEITERVWNINRGTGRAGNSGTQGSTDFTAVPEPAQSALALGLAALASARLRRRGLRHCLSKL